MTNSTTTTPANVLGNSHQNTIVRHHLDKRAGDILEAAAAGDDDELLSTLSVANWLGVSVQWLEIGRVKLYGPPYLRLAPQLIRYRKGTVKEWLAQRVHANTSEYLSNRERDSRTPMVSDHD